MCSSSPLPENRVTGAHADLTSHLAPTTPVHTPRRSWRRCFRLAFWRSCARRQSGGKNKLSRPRSPDSERADEFSRAGTARKRHDGVSRRDWRRRCGLEFRPHRRRQTRGGTYNDRRSYVLVGEPFARVEQLPGRQAVDDLVTRGVHVVNGKREGKKKKTILGKPATGESELMGLARTAWVCVRTTCNGRRTSGEIGAAGARCRW